MRPNTWTTMATALGLVVGFWLIVALPVLVSVLPQAPLWVAVLVGVVMAGLSMKWKRTARAAVIAVRPIVSVRRTSDNQRR